MYLVPTLGTAVQASHEHRRRELSGVPQSCSIDQTGQHLRSALVSECEPHEVREARFPPLGFALAEG